jgi:hypothetical protein
MKRIYVTTSIEIKDGADPEKVVEEMNYKFKHPKIKSHYILSYRTNPEEEKYNG